MRRVSFTAISKVITTSWIVWTCLIRTAELCLLTSGQLPTALTKFTSGLVGTKTHWSPEFYEDCYGQKVDVWAYGVVIHELLQGCLPFRHLQAVKYTEPQLDKNLPEPCVALIRNLLKKEQALRLSALQALNQYCITTDEQAKSMNHCL